jgi:hypothetical protein
MLVGWSDRTEHQAVFARHLRLKIEVQLTVFKPSRLESANREIREGVLELNGDCACRKSRTA